MKSLTAAVTACLLASPALGQGLPGGASSLNETYRNWVLSCVAQEASARCAITHQQQDPQSRQRILAIEVSSAGDGAARGILVMPFGLKLADGAELLVPDLPPVELAFTTCLPAGCILPLSLDKDLVTALGKGGTAELRAMSVEGGKTVAFSVPLDGFGDAFTRLGSLTN